MDGQDAVPQRLCGMTLEKSLQLSAGPQRAGARWARKIAVFSNLRIATMGNKIVTEADRKFTKPLPGAVSPRQGVGQKRSQERGSHTRSKKNPGKRPHQG